MKCSFYNLLIGISGFLSCAGPSDSIHPRYTTFPEEKAVLAQESLLDTAIFRYPYRISVHDQVAIVMDLHNPDYFFHAFRYPQWEHITSFGKRGEGPEEMLSAETFQFNSPDSIWALDANKMQITRWSVSPASRSAERQETISLDKKLVRSLDFCATDNQILIPGYLGECRYWQVDYSGKAFNSVSEIASETHWEADTYPALAQSWRSFMDYNPHNGVLAMVTQLGEVLEIFNEKDGSHIVLYGPNGEPKFKKTSDGQGVQTLDAIKGFSDVVVTDRYIYAPFEGSVVCDELEMYKQGKEPEDGARSIYVFDLKGNPVRKYTLDKPIKGIDVDEGRGTILATCVESDDPILELRI